MHPGCTAAAAAGATFNSTRATLDSSSTRTSVVAVLVLLRTARASLKRTSLSRYILAYEIIAPPKNDQSIAWTQRARDEHEHDAAKQSRAHEH